MLDRVHLTVYSMWYLFSIHPTPLPYDISASIAHVKGPVPLLRAYTLDVPVLGLFNWSATIFIISKQALLPNSGPILHLSTIL